MNTNTVLDFGEFAQLPMEWVTVAHGDPKFYLKVAVRRKSIRRRTKIRKLLRGGKYK